MMRLIKLGRGRLSLCSTNLLSVECHRIRYADGHSALCLRVDGMVVGMGKIRC